MRRTFESLETKRLLAVDLEVIQDPFPDASPGDEVTRVIRVFADEAVEARVRSSVGNELEDASWRRLDGYGKQLDVGAFADPTRSFAIEKAIGKLEPAGDLNGDGRDDLLWRKTVLFGGLDSDVEFPLTDQSNVGVELATSGQPLGDVNGDGLYDLAVGNGIVFGNAEFNPAPNTSIVDVDELFGIGDVNGDGFDDMLASYESSENSFIRESHLIMGGETIDNSDTISLAELESQGRGIRLDIPYEILLLEAHPVGDFNSDGFDDSVIVSSTTPQLLYGGEGLPNRVVPLNGFNTIGASLMDPEFGLAFAFEVAGAGDVNGDGSNDIVFSFSNGGCLSCTASERGVTDNMGGAVVVFGGIDSDNDVFRPDMQKNWDLKISKTTLDSISTDVQDVNQDGFADVHITASFSGQRRDNLLLGQAEPTDVDLGHAFFPYQGFDGQNGFELPSRSQLIDVNADGNLDLVQAVRRSIPGPYDLIVYPGNSLLPSVPAIGQGDIDEIVQLDRNRSVIYEVTGTKRNDALPITTVVAPLGDTVDVNLVNNIASDKTLVGIDIGVAETRNEDTAEIEIELTNNGPYAARSMRVTETLSASFQDVMWARSEQTFPDVVSLENLPPGLGSTLASPEYVRFGEFDNFLQRLNSYQDRTIYRSLGIEVGSAGDENGDGLDDIYVMAETEGFDRNHDRLLFTGNTQFGSDGEFPRPASRDGDASLAGPSVNRPVSGDINRDGLADSVRVSENGQDIHVIFGNLSNSEPELSELDGSNGFSILNLDPEEWRNGYSLAIGDLNGDGFDDVIAADALNEIFAASPDDIVLPNVHVIYGKAAAYDPEIDLSRIRSDVGFRIEGVKAVEFGFEIARRLTVASGFDVNGDGIDDLLIGDADAGAFTSEEYMQHHGEAYLILGRTSTRSTGMDAIDELIDLPVGTQVTYTVTGTLPPDQSLNGSVNLQLGPDQIDLFMNELSYSVEPIAGDVDGNGTVNFADFLILSANFGETDAAHDEGDLDGDGKVAFADFLILSANFDAD